MGFATLLFALLAAHALCDYPLQGEYLALHKNHRLPLPDLPWYQALTAHALIHGGAVLLLTGSLVLGLAELVAHVVIDYAKSEEITNINQDQLLHVICKIAWALIVCFA